MVEVLARRMTELNFLTLFLKSGYLAAILWLLPLRNPGVGLARSVWSQKIRKPGKENNLQRFRAGHPNEFNPRKHLTLRISELCEYLTNARGGYISVA
jgi:hypothetical protein